MKKETKTATEIMEEGIEVPCYLCGEGKIIMRRGDICARFGHPIDYKIRVELEKHLLKETKKFLTDIFLKTKRIDSKNKR